MQLDRFTIKAQEAIQAALKIAADRRHTETSPDHLLLALLEQPEGIVLPVLKKLGADPAAIRREANARLQRAPTSATAPPGPAPAHPPRPPRAEHRARAARRPARGRARGRQAARRVHLHRAPA